MNCLSGSILSGTIVIVMFAQYSVKLEVQYR